MGTLASHEDLGEIPKIEFALFAKTTQSSEKEIQHFFGKSKPETPQYIQMDHPGLTVSYDTLWKSPWLKIFVLGIQKNHLIETVS